MARPLGYGFYERDPAKVARSLLGKTLVRVLGSNRLEGTIVETEAYYGLDDPASRAFRGLKAYNEVMWGEPGRLFIYNVHRYWMLNFVAHEPGGVGGILIRALEPTRGVDAMLVNRPVEKTKDLASGPGRLSVALAIDKSLNGLKATDEACPVHVMDAEAARGVKASKRIGVTHDLPQPLRFYIHGNRFVSR